ncbi:hypothetical protein ABI59_22045 [Acidobacteria bacterium Mor1]|nr:hypothetical protein ABI59_22045 [Acidobacteria bacterium Mor1]
MPGPRSTLRRLSRRSAVLLGRYRPPADAVLLGTAMLVGITAGFGGVAFRWLIHQVEHICFDLLPRWTAGAGSSYVVLAPMLGGLIVGPLIYYFAREAKGHGVPEVMAAVALKGGRIRPRVAIVKSLASAVSIGSGASVGREGPIVQIGSTIGSTVGQLLRLSETRTKTLVASGAAAGIAATFNAPIAGVIFAMEVILSDFGTRAFGTVVVSSVTASVIGRAAFGDVPAFATPDYAIESLWEFPMYAVLGVIAALVAVLYSRSIYKFEDLFDAWKGVPEWFKPAIGGVLLGCLALLYSQAPGLGFDGVPQVYAVGYSTIESGLSAEPLLPMLGVMLALMALKILATSITLGSGGSGGVFAPGLFIGSMLGGSFGILMHQLFPELPGPPGAYALVGMGAVFAGSTHAAMTAVIMMFEMTGDYTIILPLMLTVVTATLVSRQLTGGESIYTMKLTRRGVNLKRGQDADVLQGVRAAEVMSESPTVLPETPLRELTELFLQTNRHAFPVADAQERLEGIVSLADLRNSAGSADDLTVRDIMTSSVVTARREETLDAVLRKMGPRDLSRLPVIDDPDNRRVLGVVRRNDIVRAYNLALTRRSSDALNIPMNLRRAETVEFLEVEVDDRSHCLGKTVAELSRELPEESLLISVRRIDGSVIFPHGDTRFEAGDRITAYARRGHLQGLRRCLVGGNEPPVS